MFRSKKLSKLSIINHGFFNKKGGVSKGIYRNLNCGIGSKDKKVDIQKNPGLYGSRLIFRRIQIDIQKTPVLYVEIQFYM